MAADSTIVAVLGIGDWGKNLVRVFEEVARVRYVLHEGADENREWVVENHPDVTVTTNYGTILQDDRVDAVVIATPISTHAELARRALQADKHVFVEKPLTTADEDPCQLVALADDRRRSLFVGYVYLYDEAIQRLADWEDDIVQLVQGWRKLGSFDAPLLENIVCHDIAIAKALLGEAVTAVSVTNAYGAGTRLDGLQTTLSMADGVRADISVDRVSPTDHKSVTAVTAAGEVLVWIDGRLLRLDEVTGEFELVHERTQEPLRREAEAFVRTLRTDWSPPTDGRFGAAVDSTLSRLRSAMPSLDKP